MFIRRAERQFACHSQLRVCSGYATIKELLKVGTLRFHQLAVTPNSAFVSRGFTVTDHSNVSRESVLGDAERLAEFLGRSKHLIAVTGAGISTSSGIPDYRGPNGSYLKGHKPMVHQNFIADEVNRKRYWARSLFGWQVFSAAKPNDAHFSLAKLEASGVLRHTITQNVDGLHQAAGSFDVVDLHGRNDRVRCLGCGTVVSRNRIQSYLSTMNPTFVEQVNRRINVDIDVRADGDIELHTSEYDKFMIPSCQECGGILKPDVVMFGDNVPSEKAKYCYQQVEKCDSMLVVGSSLEVFSAFRFVNRANKLGVPIAIINFGETRAERAGLQQIKFKSDANCVSLLSDTVELMSPR